MKISIRIDATLVGQSVMYNELSVEMFDLGFGHPVVMGAYWVYHYDAGDNEDWALDLDNLFSPEVWDYREGTYLDPRAITQEAEEAAKRYANQHKELCERGERQLNYYPLDHLGEDHDAEEGS